MRRHLATIDGTRVAQRLLEKGVSGLGLHGAAARRRHHVLRVPYDAGIMDDRGPRLLGQKGLGQQTHDIFPRNEAPRVIEQEAAVEIAVPGNAHIRPGGNDRCCGGRLVFGQQRVGNAVRERPVRVVMHPNEAQRCPACLQRSGNGVKGRASGTVAGIDQDGHGAERCRINEGQHTLHIGRARALGLTDPAARDDRQRICFCKGLDFGQTCGRIQRSRSFAHQLHAVVIDGIVRRCHFNPTVGGKMGDGKVHFFGSAQAKVDHLGPARHKPVDAGLQQNFRRLAAIAAHHDAAGVQRRHKGTADPPRDILVQLCAQFAPDVIGLEACQIGHCTVQFLHGVAHAPPETRKIGRVNCAGRAGRKGRGILPSRPGCPGGMTEKPWAIRPLRRIWWSRGGSNS